VEQIAEGLWRWTARHPEWHPGQWGSEVASFAVDAGDVMLLIDPLVEAADQLDAIVSKPVAILITIPYHVRSSEEIRHRFRGEVETTIWGHRACRKRLSEDAGFRAFEPGDGLPAGASAYKIGKPRRYETPVHLPSHGALVFGDAVAEVDGELRVWSGERVDASVSRFYRERFNPTLEPLLELDFQSVLVTHGQPVLANGRKELERALAADPWYHRE